MSATLMVLAASALGGCMGGSVSDSRGAAGAPGETGTDAQGVCTSPLPPPATPTRLLTRNEYNNTVRDLLGDDSRPADGFAAEPRVLGFENNTEAHRVNGILLAQYVDASERLAAAAGAKGEAFVGCNPQTVGEQVCGETFVVDFGRRAFRRALTSDERATFVGFFERTRAQTDFSTAVEWTVQLFLQSPQFLYRLEQGPAGATGPSTRLAAHALASRLSYFLWSSMPDEALLVAAEDGTLDTDEGLEAQARRMLDDSRARDTVQSFFRQWLHLDALDHLEKDTATFPAVQGLGPSWRGSLERFVEEVAWNGPGTLDALLSAPDVYVDAALASVYDVPPPDAGWKRAELPDGKRAGLLTQPGLLAMLAGRVDSSPIQRGIFVREKLLCQTLPAPPANVPITPPDPDPNATTRERFAEHTANPTCAGCHQLIDPLGFGFEHYDAIGRYRDTENQLPVDASGALTGVQDEALAGPFDGALELSLRLAGSGHVSSCVSRQWFRFAMGRLEANEDACSLAQAQLAFEKSGRSFRELLIGIVRSDAFRTRKLEVTR